MKLCREMVDAMGGADSEAYRRFRSLAAEAYNILRKSAPLLLSLAHLMAGSSIPDIHAAPEKALLKLQVGAWVSACVCVCMRACKNGVWEGGFRGARRAKALSTWAQRELQD